MMGLRWSRLALACASALLLSPAGNAQNSGIAAVEFAAATFTAVPSSGGVTVSVTRSGDTSSAVIVSYATENGTATAGIDYGATSGVLSWGSGDASPRSFVVPIVPGDAGNRSFGVALLSASGANFGSPFNATVTIEPASGSSGPPTVAFSSAQYTAVASTGAATVSLERAGGSAGAVVASYTTIDGTAVAGVDYTAQNGTVSWAAGDTAQKSFTVPISSTDTGNRSFEVALISASGANFGQPLDATVTISPTAVDSGAPSPAAGVGYNTKTFDSIALSTDTPAGPWFAFNKIGSTVTNTYTTRNSDGSLTLSFGPGGGSGYGGQLGAFNPNAGPNGWRGDNGGAAFGGGAYFEMYAAIANPNLGGPYANGGSDFWANDIEWMAGGSSSPYAIQWPANASWAAANAWNANTTYAQNALVAYEGYVWLSNSGGNTGNAPPAVGTYSNAWWTALQQHIEWDFMEWDVAPGYYQNGIGNWTINNASTYNAYEGFPGSAGSVPLIPATSQASQPHYYGLLWVPATPSTQGYIEFYFDRQLTATGRYSWNYWNAASPPNPPGTIPWTNIASQDTNGLASSIVDHRHMALILAGDNYHPMTVYSVQVWQASSDSNIVQ